MAKRLSEKQKKEIIESFIQKESVDTLSKKFNCTNSTIIRNLKKHLGDLKYKELTNKNNSSIKNTNSKNDISNDLNFDSNNSCSTKDFDDIKNLDSNSDENDLFQSSSFLEITPLDYEIDEVSQKDLSSVAISDVEFPNVVYMIVDKKIELEIKLLKDYPEWSFLPEDDLNRKTISVYLDLKIAKRFCKKEQKVIKVPNTNVFRIVAPLLISRGISRIVSNDKLIAL